MDSSVISPSSRTRLVVASQALEIQHLQDLLRATEREMNDTAAKLVTEKQELERKLLAEQQRSKRLDEQVRLLGEKLRSTEQQLQSALNNNNNVNNHQQQHSPTNAMGLQQNYPLATVQFSPPQSSRQQQHQQQHHSSSVLDSVLTLGSGAGSSFSSTSPAQQNQQQQSFASNAPSSTGAVHDGGNLNRSTSELISTAQPQQQQQQQQQSTSDLLKRIAELHATNASLLQEKEVLRNSLEDHQLQLQYYIMNSKSSRGVSEVGAGHQSAVQQLLMQEQFLHANPHIAAQLGGGSHYLSNATSSPSSGAVLMSSSPSSCEKVSRGAQTSDPSEDVFDQAAQASTIDEIRSLIVGEQLQQRYFQQLGVLHASNAQSLADLMQKRIESEMEHLQSKHDEYRKMLHSIPAVAVASSSNNNNRNRSDNKNSYNRRNVPPESGGDDDETRGGGDLNEGSSAAHPHLPPQQRPQRLNQHQTSPSASKYSSSFFFGNNNNNNSAPPPPPPPLPSSLPVPSFHQSVHVQQQQQQPQESTAKLAGDVNFVRQQQHEMAVLKRRLDELQERHRNLRQSNYGQPLLIDSSKQYEKSGFLSSTLGAAHYLQQQQSQQPQQPQQQQQQQFQQNYSPTPRNLFPVPAAAVPIQQQQHQQQQQQFYAGGSGSGRNDNSTYREPLQNRSRHYDFKDHSNNNNNNRSSVNHEVPPPSVAEAAAGGGRGAITNSSNIIINNNIINSVDHIAATAPQQQSQSQPQQSAAIVAGGNSIMRRMMAKASSIL